jgi:hypothetical protein
MGCIWLWPARLGLIGSVSSHYRRYRLSRSLAARIWGTLLLLLGVAVLLLTLGVGLLGLPVSALGAGVFGSTVLVLLAAVLLARRTTVVRLDDVGYRVRLVRGAGVTQGRWVDVEDVVATTVAGERCVVLRLRDGRTTTIPVRMLEGSTDAFLSDLQGHLNRGHGYRRLG